MQLRSGLQGPTELELEDGFQAPAKPTVLPSSREQTVWPRDV